MRNRRCVLTACLVCFFFLHKRGWKVECEAAFDVVAEPPESNETHGQYNERDDGHADVQHSHGRREPVGLFHFQL